MTEAALLEGARGKAPTASAAAFSVSGELRFSGIEFATARSSRRELACLISDSCDDMDPERVRTYFEGGYSLGKIDADAHSRVVYGACRNPFLRSEKRLAVKLAWRTGAFSGIGLARAVQKDRRLDPDASKTYRTYSSRSKLDKTVARFGVMVANGILPAEAYWQGTIALLPGGEAKSEWRSAVVWLRDGKVARILLNVLANDKLGDLPKVVAGTYLRSTGRVARHNQHVVVGRRRGR